MLTDEQVRESICHELIGGPREPLELIKAAATRLHLVNVDAEKIVRYKVISMLSSGTLSFPIEDRLLHLPNS